MKLVIHPAVDQQRLRQIIEAAGPMTVVNVENADRAKAELADADAFFGKITPQMLADADRLRWVQAPTASMEHYLFPELVAHRAMLTNMRGLFSDVITDHVFAYILCFARNFHCYFANQRRARWEAVGGENGRSDFLFGPAFVTSIDRAHIHLADATLGIVGLGAIGRELAQRATAFGMRVAAVDPVVTTAPPSIEYVWTPDRLCDLLAVSDFVVIAAPHTPETEKMFRLPQFAAMKPTAYLINVGRGAIVDLTDLAQALRQATIAGAGLDVFETEPLPADHPLWKMENVIITPHVAAASPHIAERHLAVLLDNIGRFVRGEPLVNIVDKTRWF